MTLRKLRVQARYNVLTPAALIGISSALLMGAPAFAAAQTNTGNVTSILVGANNAFTNTGTITTDGTHPAVYSTSDIESILNAPGASIVGNFKTGIYIDGNVTGAITNNGSISSTSEYGIDINGSVGGAITNTGNIDSWYTGIYVDGDVGSLSNSGTITAHDDAGVAIYGDISGSFTNTNMISGTWAGVRIDGDVPTFTNSGTISGTDGYGVEITGDVGTFTNSGTISAANSSYDAAVYISGDVDTFINSKNITAGPDSYDAVHILGDVGTFANSGTISSTSSYYGYGVNIGGHVDTFINSGTISSTSHEYGYGVYIGDGVTSFANSGTIAVSSASNGYGAELYGDVGSFTNSGTISVNDVYRGWGVYMSGNNGTFTNSGTISVSDAQYARGAYLSGSIDTFTNSGTISATGSSQGYGVYADASIGSFMNSGTIEGSTVGVYLTADDVTLTNSGHIGSTGGLGAIYFGGENSILRLLTGGSFGGGVEWADNFGASFDFSHYHGNLILEEYGSLPTGNVVPGDNLYLQTTHQVIIVGDSSVTNSSHPVSDITNGINNLITNQLDFGSGGGGDGAPLGFAPVRVNSAAEMATAKAMAPKVQDGQVFWAQGIGGGSSNGVDASDVFGALVVGTHVQLQDGLKAGGLGAYAHSIATTDSSQTITADTGIIGAYGRAELDTISLDFSILAGASTNASARTIAGPGGPETASATFGGWFINPTIGVSMPVLSSDKGDLSVIGSVGYLFGGFGGYTETGSSANLTVGAQTIGILDAAFGVKGKKDIGSNEHGVIVGKGTAELFAESNMGTSSVPISVLGTTIGNSLPPTALALGVRSSLSVEVPISDSVSFTGGGSVSLRTDGLISGAATAKISGSF